MWTLGPNRQQENRRYSRERTMKVLIVGATGTIGKPLMAELMLRRHSVTGNSRSAAQIQEIENVSGAIFFAEVRDAKLPRHDRLEALHRPMNDHER